VSLSLFVCVCLSLCESLDAYKDALVCSIVAWIHILEAWQHTRIRSGAATLIFSYGLAPAVFSE